MEKRLTLKQQEAMKPKIVDWTKLRRGSKIIHKGKILTVEIIDKPNRHNSFPKITFVEGGVISPLYLTRFKRISY